MQIHPYAVVYVRDLSDRLMFKIPVIRLDIDYPFEAFILGVGFDVLLDCLEAVYDEFSRLFEWPNLRAELVHEKRNALI